MGAKLGMQAKLYRQSTGVRAAWPATGAPANLVELSNVKDVTLNLETGEADVTTRANNGWKATIATLKEGSVEFEMIWDPSDAGFSAMKDAYFNNTPVALAILDGAKDVAGSQGLWADFSVTNLTREEPLEDAIKAKVTVKPTYSAIPPAWVTVAA
ncbi:phage tail tube protein [Oscillatoria laete-virens NRMC-F 0139]|nr:phage tail tube protein [Oscillatoria laete-virens]MDL5053358.1 phage tail tube protein [Oscillatoria laete-virens NRMC-F 0139]